MNPMLFPDMLVDSKIDPENDQNIHQFYPTPIWIAEQLIERHFPNLGKQHTVCEAGCGTGEFLNALPDFVNAYGIEIDTDRAAIARATTGRTIIEGDFTTAKLPSDPTHVIGNPPFDAEIIDQFLERSHLILPDEGKIGWILPAYLFQTSGRIARYSTQWSIDVEMIPRNIFHRIKLPLSFAVFTKNHERRLIGLALYQEYEDWKTLRDQFRDILAHGKRPVWKRLVEVALTHLGGHATLSDIYRVISPNRPTTNQFWREKIRQICQIHFHRLSDGHYSLTPKDAVA
jgi:predicted RNA methylase